MVLTNEFDTLVYMRNSMLINWLETKQAFQRSYFENQETKIN